MLIPVAGAIEGATWVVVFYAFRYVSLASICAAVISASWLRPYHVATRAVVTVLAFVVILRHRENITRLLNGTENKFVKKPPEKG